VASYTYDASGRLATTTDPLRRTDRLFYDGSVGVNYDSDSRVTGQTANGGNSITFVGRGGRRSGSPGNTASGAHPYGKGSILPTGSRCSALAHAEPSSA
jgi:hypothetical protein